MSAPADEKKTAKARTEALALMQEVMSSGDKYFLCDFARDMNRLGLWNMRQRGPLVSLIAAQKRRIPPRRGCYHCGRFGHRATACRFGGSYRRVTSSKYQRRGDQPRCFVCARYTKDHMSADCPLRHPESYLPIDNCWHCAFPFIGVMRNHGKCVKCGNHSRCWNCGRSGHKLTNCLQPRRSEGAREDDLAN